MTDDLASRLAALEREVQRAVDVIGTLRAEQGRLLEERTTLADKVETLTAELAGLRAREESRVRLEAEHRGLLEERQHVLSQVESLLKELSRIEGV